MRYIDNDTDFKLHDTVVTIGKFDGMHRGHQLLLEALREYRAQGLTSVVMTFDMQPMSVLYGRDIDPIYSWEEKVELLRHSGPDVLIRYPFTKELAAMTPEDFVRDILVDRLGVKAMVVGDDFRFGCNRSGDAAALKSFGEQYGFEVRIVERLRFEGEPISSTLIRKMLTDGRTGEAEELLNRQFFSAR